MPVIDGYCSLADLKKHLQDVNTYTASTLGFTSGTKTIADTAYGLKRFKAGDVIKISGAVNPGNNGLFTIVTGNLAASLVVVEPLVTEAAGASITITVWGELDDDTLLERAIEGASRIIDEFAMTRFYTSVEDEMRYYTPESSTVLRLCDGLDDILSIAEVAVDSAGNRTYATVLAATAYDLLPLNAPLRGEPYTRLQVNWTGGYPFTPFTYPVGSVRITGKFGYSAAAPAQIEEACRLLSAYMFKLKDSPLGVVGSTTIGQIITEPKVAQMVLQILTPIRNRRTRALV